MLFAPLNNLFGSCQTGSTMHSSEWIKYKRLDYLRYLTFISVMSLVFSGNFLFFVSFCRKMDHNRQLICRKSDSPADFQEIHENSLKCRRIIITNKELFSSTITTHSLSRLLSKSISHELCTKDVSTWFSITKALIKRIILIDVYLF